MIDISWVIAMVCSVEEAEYASWSSVVASWEDGRGSALRMPVWNECPEWSRGRGAVKVLVHAALSSKTIMSGGPAGCCKMV